jgi:thymidine kinase
MIPTFTIYTGPMYGSKTSRLIADVDRFSRQKKSVLAFKPRLDDRVKDLFA